MADTTVEDFPILELIMIFLFLFQLPSSCSDKLVTSGLISFFCVFYNDVAVWLYVNDVKHP